MELEQCNNQLKKCKCGRDAMFIEYTEKSLEIMNEEHENTLLNYDVARKHNDVIYLCYHCAKKSGWFLKSGVYLTNYGKAKLPGIHNAVINKIKQNAIGDN